MMRTANKKSDQNSHSKASPVESPFNVEGENYLGPARQIELRSSTALVLDRALDFDKALDFWIVNPIQRTSSSVPTVRCWMVSWSDNHEGKYPYRTLCESVSERNEKTNGL